MEFGYPSFHKCFTYRAIALNRPLLAALLSKNIKWNTKDIEKAFNLFVKQYSNSCALIVPKKYKDRQSRFKDESKFDVVLPKNGEYYTSDDLYTEWFKLNSNQGCAQAEVVLFLTTLAVFGEILPQFKICLTRGVKDGGVDVAVFKDAEMKEMILALDSKYGLHANINVKDTQKYEFIKPEVLLDVFYQKKLNNNEQFIDKKMTGISVGRFTYEAYVKCLLSYVARTQKKHNQSLTVYKNLEMLSNILNREAQ